MIEQLRDAGHTSISARVEFAGASVLPILERAVQEDLLLLSADLDLGEYIFRGHRPAPAAGIVQLRLDAGLKEAGKAWIVADGFAVYEPQCAGKFTVIEQNKARFRPPP